MKKFTILFLLGICIVGLTSAVKEDAVEVPVKGAWQLIKAKYDAGRDYEPSKEDEKFIKMFTGSQWSGIVYNMKTLEIGGSDGGTYVLKGSEYRETVAYFSWDKAAVGKTF